MNYAVLLAPDFALQALRRAEPALQGQPVALAQGEGRKARLAEVSREAATVEPGLAVTLAMARCPGLIIRTREPNAEVEANRLMLAAAFTLSPRVESTSDGCCTVDLQGADRRHTEAQMHAGVAELAAAGLGKLTADGSFELVAFKDGDELGPSVTLPALPITRIVQMAQQLAAETDCAVDIIPLASKDALASYAEAIREAFVEEGQPLEKADIPAHALKIPASFPALKAMGTTHVIVTAFQNIKGADIVLVVAKGQFTEDAQAKAKTTLGVRNANESTLVLARWVDGEEKGTAEAQSTTTTKSEHPMLERRKGPGKK